MVQAFAEELYQAPLAQEIAIDHLHAGAVLGPYQLERVVAETAMSKVFRARHRDLLRPSAVKVLKPWTDMNEATRAMIKEARIAASISSRHSLEVYDFARHPHFPYIATEFIEGPSLKGLLLSKTFLPPSEAISYVGQTLEGLIAIGQRNVVHADIKPENLLIGRQGHVKIIDFGIARYVNDDDHDGNNDLTTGTPMYMSPEQWNNAALDQQSDQYSLGVTAYQLVTGDLPFKGTDLDEIYHQMARNQFVPAHHVRPGITETLSGIISRMMHANPKKRFPSMGECLQAWQAIAREETTRRYIRRSVSL